MQRLDNSLFRRSELAQGHSISDYVSVQSSPVIVFVIISANVNVVNIGGD